MRTFCLQTLGCKVNQYESEQIATLLRARGLVEVESVEQADVRVVNSCSVTVQAASKSRQTVRRATRLPVLTPSPCNEGEGMGVGSSSSSLDSPRPRVILTGCWATSDKYAASRLTGVDAVIGHHDDVADAVERLLESWNQQENLGPARDGPPTAINSSEPQVPKPFGNEGSISQAGASALQLAPNNKPRAGKSVKQNLPGTATVGTRSLPLLVARQEAHQRALLKIQDGCDAHCTYCIIPQLRPTLGSKPIDDAVAEAQRLIDAGHVEIVLTGIFLGAYGQPTAIRKRQSGDSGKPLGALVEALCTRVAGLRRLRFSSLEPGDLRRDLIEVLRSYDQCVPHFHLPLQSGSDELLRRMNRQYTRDEFLRMIDDVHDAFDRPAITTDVIVGFPGETDERFARTLEVVDRVRFVHIHAFSFSPRPNTAAARWTRDFIRGPVVNERIDLLNAGSRAHGFDFRRLFEGEEVELLVERETQRSPTGIRHGRCERWFDVHFECGDEVQTGELVRVRIDRVTPQRTWGMRVKR